MITNDKVDAVKAKSFVGLLAAVVLSHLWGIERPTYAATKDPEYLPYAVGTEYVMDLEAIDPAGKRTKGQAYRRTQERVERDGKTYFKIRTWTEGAPFMTDYTKLIRKDETGVYSIDDRMPDAKEEREIVLPLKIGTVWNWTTPAGEMKCSVVAKESITVAGKEYRDCFRLKQESIDGNYIEEFWEAPGIGSVRAVMRIGGGTITLTLREFKRGRD